MSDATEDGDLRAALRGGDAARVRELIAAGSDIRYKREHGYDALIDAAYGAGAMPGPMLLEVLAVLVEHGVDLSGIASYGESGLRVLSRLGRFDAVRFLLEAGADRRHLEWTPLMEAVALGSIADVRGALARGADLEARDWWSRTAWLIALAAGDIEKAKLLRRQGVDVNARGRCGQPATFYPIETRRPEVLRWLIAEGADVNAVDEFGATALIETVEHDDLESVEILLRAGADVRVDCHGTALRRATSRGIVLRLLEAGADPADLTSAGQRAVAGLPEVDESALSAVTRESYRRSFGRTFGMDNPERMRVPFWEAMVRSGVRAYDARRRFGEEGGPVWCADRFGQSMTLLPDGRVVQIAGEHEDSYDPDFCIYNDVFVHGADRSLEIYGYPEDVFPPTDFHTVTLVGDFIYVIGSLGYAGTRRYGKTPVYRLDVRSWRMRRMDVRGEGPGWIYKHGAALVEPGQIRIWGGTVVTAVGSRESHEENRRSFLLDLERYRWRPEGDG